MKPRVEGAWNLHHHFPTLDFFIMLFSATGIIGNRGQAAYTASNTFFESFAAYRISRGLPAASIDIGVVDDVGYIAEADASRRAIYECLTHDMIDERELQALLKESIMNSSKRNGYQQTINCLKPFPGPKIPWSGFDPKFSHVLHSARSASIKDTAESGAVNIGKLLREATSTAEASSIICDALIRRSLRFR